MPTVVASNNGHGTMPGVAMNMPMMAVNTMSEVTRGLQSEKKLFMLTPKFCIVLVLVVIERSHWLSFFTSLNLFLKSVFVGLLF